MNTIHRSLLVLTLSSAILGACRTAAPDAPAISTDRPGLLFSPALVPQGALQLEIGASLAKTQDVDAWGALAQWRYGLSPRVELRATAPNLVSVDGGGADEDGFGDTEIGAKFAVGEQGGLDSTLALITSLRLPTGDDEFTAHQPGYGVFLAAARPLGEGTTLVGLAGLTRTPSGSEDLDAAQLGVLVGRSLSETTSGYLEVSAFPTLEHAPSSAYAGGGLTWLLRSNMQFDASLDIGLDDDAADWLAGVGFSIRW